MSTAVSSSYVDVFREGWLMTMRGLWIALAIAVAFASASYASPSVAPIFPFGVYDKSSLEPGTPAWSAHYHDLMNLLVANQINTVVVPAYHNPAHTRDIFDKAYQRSVRVIMTAGNPLNPQWDYAGPDWPFAAAYAHPAVIAFKYGDEPKSESELRLLDTRYASIHQNYQKPIVTAVLGELMDFSPTDIALQSWRELHSEIRFARYYPMRRSYDLLRWDRDKMKMSFQDWAAKMESIEETPWWYITQTFGKGKDQNTSSFWRFPTANELNAIVHIALANGARGIFAYALQDHEGQYIGLLNQDLTPNTARDKSVPLHQFAKIGALVEANGPLLLRHMRGNFKILIDIPEILAIPRIDVLDGKRYVYLVNLDTENIVEGTLTVQNKISRATDIYTGKTLEGRAAGTTSVRFLVKLGPGEAQFLQLIDQKASE